MKAAFRLSLMAPSTFFSMPFAWLSTPAGSTLIWSEMIKPGAAVLASCSALVLSSSDCTLPLRVMTPLSLSSATVTSLKLSLSIDFCTASLNDGVLAFWLVQPIAHNRTNRVAQATIHFDARINTSGISIQGTSRIRRLGRKQCCMLVLVGQRVAEWLD